LTIQASPSWRTYQQNSGVSMQPINKAPTAIMWTGAVSSRRLPEKAKLREQQVEVVPEKPRLVDILAG